MRSLTVLRQDARAIFDAGLSAVDPVAAIKGKVRVEGAMLELAGRRYFLDDYRHVYVVGAGKAAAAMARGIEELLGARISRGLAIVKYGHGLPLKKVEVAEAGHPLPDGAGVEGTRKIMEIVDSAREDDLVILLLSGGGSALLAYPAHGLTLADKQRATQVLLGCGATIHEINAIRKHLSKVKGGGLARLAYPATTVALILSDVLGDSLDIIASGPMAPDTTRFADCLDIVERYRIGGTIPSTVLGYLEKGARGETDETSKPGDRIFTRVENVIVASNRQALQAAKHKAEALGYNTLLLSSFVQGETHTAASLHTAIAREIVETDSPVPRPACLLSGGETTIILRGDGLGGRNQEFALGAAIEIEGLEGVVVLSGGTDGTDGPTEAAGGLVDGTTLRRAREKGLDARSYLRRNDSYPYLKAAGDLLITGPTLTNVMDIHIVLVG